MPTLIIHKDGAYNLFTTVADGPYYESALTLEQLKQVLNHEADPAHVDERIARAHATGCSSRDGMTLLECIEFNRAGPSEACMPVDEFITKYLTHHAGG
jgi:hypothetical protein